MTGAAQRMRDLHLKIQLWQMMAQGIEDRAAAREALGFPKTAAEYVKAQRRMYNAVARAKAKRLEARRMLNQLEELERAAASSVDLDGLGL